MWRTVLLAAPALIPSWRFFKAIEPSPRVQWALLGAGEDRPAAWREFRPRPQSVSLAAMLRRLFWNPAWNEALFLTSCAERIAEQPTAHSIAEIERRIWREIGRGGIDAAGRRLQFRLIFVRRGAAGLEEELVFLSDPSPAFGGAGR